MKNNNIKNITLCSIFISFTVICSWISFSFFSVPLTLQTFAISFAGFVLGFKKGTFSILTYIILGLLGIPVFSFFNSGIGYISGPTGGFIIGFLPLCFFCGLSEKIKSKTFKLLLSFAGLFLCHLLGVIQYSLFNKIPFISAFYISSIPYILKDLICVLGAFLMHLRIKKLINVNF